ncbi:DUF4265 domain-containing protein [Virgisporangium aurantiacum]|uniref:DUF4265 domain-containing protein n=1 Tax=Virgisporangium aurantiacum TaxID=175570 RepID=A0A8J3Z3U1_9ACTN|nr:DUF4265 domain-containing protein [Virgisporangium aurantiacum]GIJ54518.1 hypothetical protein Vau01_020340 [Virgisporangium aurantiacum]
MEVEKVEREHTHVMLLAGGTAEGQPVHEQVPATVVSPGVYDVLASPALVYDCAAGDRIRVTEDGTFEVLRRGGNLCLVIWPAAPPADPDITVLTTAFERLGGIVETPVHRRFIVITVPVSAGFPAIEEIVDHWTADHECPWSYGNVYDADDKPLNWWLAP